LVENLGEERAGGKILDDFEGEEPKEKDNQPLTEGTQPLRGFRSESASWI